MSLLAVFPLNDPPPEDHLTGWGSGSFIGFMLLAVVLWAVAGTALWFLDLATDDSIWLMIAAGVVTFAAALGGSLVQGSVARHFDDFSWVWFFFSLAAIGGLALRAGTLRNYGVERFGYGIAGFAAVVVLFNTGLDGVSRFAAGLPIGLTALAVLAIGVVAWAREHA